MATGIVVIDVSHWQGKWPGPDTPYEAMARNGIVGVILKATEGTGYVDDTFHERRDKLVEHGVATSSYHYLRHGSITQQMNLFLNTVKPRQGERMVLDWEEADVTVDELKQAISYLLTDSRKVEVTVYASSGFLQEHVPDKPDSILGSTSLWVARYSSEEPYWPENVWPCWSLWQCTQEHYIEGYGPLDGNKFNGSVENCIEWLNPAGSEPVSPEPRPPLVEVLVTVTQPPGTKIVVNVVELTDGAAPALTS